MSGTIRPYVLLFLFLSALYHSNLRPIASGDSLPASLVPFSLLLDSSIALDRFGPYIDEHIWYSDKVVQKIQGHWYSLYPVAGPILATPLYTPVALIPWIRRQPPETLISIARIAEKVVAVALAAAAAVFLLILLRSLTSDRTAWMLTLVFAVGTGSWSTASQALWQHTFGQVAIIGCLYAIERLSASDASERWYWFAGIFAACAVAIRPTNVAIVPALALSLCLRPARPIQYVRVFAPVTLAGLVIASYNLSVFHRLTGGYPPTLDGRLLQGLLGILLSPGRGLLVYTPVAVFAIAAFFPSARESRRQHRLVACAASTFALLNIAIIAKWPIWWGGYCWGPRLLTEILAPAMVLIAIGMPAIRFRALKPVFAITVLYCSLIQALGVYCYPKGRWDHLPISVDDDPARLWNWPDNPIIRTMNGGIAWEPYSIAGAMVTGGLPAAYKKLKQLGINPY